MAMLVLLSFLSGTVLGMRFKVLVLLPAIACALPIALAVGNRQPGIGSVALVSAATVACLQIGYSAGIAIRRSLAAARMSGRRKTSLARSQALPHNAE
jgi:ABC-type proline/glycine betaine transport system permease subunit